MRNVFVASTITDAAVVRNLLAASGIDARLVETATSAYPVHATEVWISQDDQQQRAVELIRKLYSESANERAWSCAHCSEPNPASFELCWVCGQDAGLIGST